MCTCDTSPGPDGLPDALRRAGVSLFGAIWLLLERGGEHAVVGRPRDLGASISNMIPKVDIACEGGTAAVRVVDTRPLACGSTGCKMCSAIPSIAG